MIYNKEVSSFKKSLHPGWHIYWQKQIYRIQSLDSEKLIIHVEDHLSSEISTLRMKELLRAEENGQSVPLFAPTLEQLLREVKNLQPLPEGAPENGIPAKLLEKADEIIKVVQQVEETAERLRKRILNEGKKCTQSDALRKACVLVGTVKLTVFYDYRKKCRKCQWDRVQIAASLRRKTYNKNQTK